MADRLDNHKNKRHDERSLLEEQTLEDALVCNTSGACYSIRPVDISKRGLGFLVHKHLTPGRYQLRIKDHKFDVEVIYCNNHLGIESLFRCGLFVRNPDISLVELFEDELRSKSGG